MKERKRCATCVNFVLDYDNRGVCEEFIFDIDDSFSEGGFCVEFEENWTGLKGGDLMSWSKQGPNCYECDNESSCVDGRLVELVIDCMHHLEQNQGHKGAGVLTMDCQNFKEKVEGER